MLPFSQTNQKTKSKAAAGSVFKMHTIEKFVLAHFFILYAFKRNHF